MIAYVNINIYYKHKTNANVFNWQEQDFILLVTAETNNFDKLGDQTVKIHSLITIIRCLHLTHNLNSELTSLALQIFLSALHA